MRLGRMAAPRQGHGARGGAELTQAWMVYSDKVWPPCARGCTAPPSWFTAEAIRMLGLATALMANQSMGTATPSAVPETTSCRGWQTLP